ncbi:MAG: hybrid sensor histidine kinase/response regulator [Bacteroidota bacterium]
MNSILHTDSFTPNILIVDDVPANLRILDAILKEDGYKVRPVLSGVMALQVAEKEKPDLIILDIKMPDMDGYEVCRRLKENPDICDIPVIFISALNETKNIVKAFSFGGVDYIAKPFQAEEVKARVATHIKICRQTRELQKLNAEKDKFFSIIAHDLRNPFNSFLGFTQIMAENLQKFSKDEIQRFALSMNNSATHLFRLLENLLEWAKMQQGLITFDPKFYPLPPIVDECVEIMQHTAQSKQIEIVQDIPANLTVFADSMMLRTVVRNLVSNALKFTPKGGNILVSAKIVSEKFIEISIKDSGIGMDKQRINHLFNLGVNTSRKGTEGELSTGLGLFICKDFIEKNGGKLSVESEVEKGSTFKFTVKISDQ